MEESRNTYDVIEPTEIHRILKSHSPKQLIEMAWRLLYEKTNFAKVREADAFYLIDGVIGQLERVASQIEDGSLDVEGTEDVVPIVNEMRDLARDLSEQMNEFDRARSYVPSDVVRQIIGETKMAWTGIESGAV